MVEVLRTEWSHEAEEIVRGPKHRHHLFGLKSARTTATWDDHRGVDAFLVPIDQARQRLSFEDYRAALDRAAHQVR